MRKASSRLSRLGRESFARRVPSQDEFWSTARSLDQLQNFNLLSISTKDAAGRRTRENVLEVRQQSTNSTICGTGIAFLVLLLFFVQITFSFYTQSPQINEITVDSSNTAYDLPAFALTISLPDMSEGEVLRYILPEFWWSSINDGFTNRTNEKKILLDDFAYGASCNLSAGYQIALPEDHGTAVWPVFCMKEPSQTMKLKGRFGDSVWSFLQIKLNRCTPESLKRLPTGLHAEFSRMGGDGGEAATCASEEELAAVLGAGFGINVWFKFDRETWGSGLTEQWETLPPEGMLPSKQGWAWHVYERLSPKMSLMMNLDLLYNRAEVTNPLNAFTALFSEKPRVHEWFSFHSHVSSPSGTTSADFVQQQPFFSGILRVAQVKRLLQVRYQNVQQMVSEISGSWALALAIGALVALGHKQLYSGAACSSLAAPISGRRAGATGGKEEEEQQQPMGPLSRLLAGAWAANEAADAHEWGGGRCYDDDVDIANDEAIAVALEDLEAELPSTGRGRGPRWTADAAVHPSPDGGAAAGGGAHGHHGGAGG